MNMWPVPVLHSRPMSFCPVEGSEACRFDRSLEFCHSCFHTDRLVIALRERLARPFFEDNRNNLYVRRQQYWGVE